MVAPCRMQSIASLRRKVFGLAPGATASGAISLLVPVPVPAHETT